MGRRQKTLRSAFIATVAAAAAGGCSNHTDVTQNPPAPSCPTDQPAQGSSCEDPGLVCDFGDDGCGNPIDATCGTDGTWSVNFGGSCNPPPPCPTALPSEGSACELTPGGTPTGCSYSLQLACGIVTVDAVCETTPEQQGYLWSWNIVDGCSSMPDACSVYQDASTCDADAGCRYLHPGCADGFGAPAVEAGCYPVDDCTLTGCTTGSCETVIYDPCVDSLCDACGAETNVCVDMP